MYGAKFLLFSNVSLEESGQITLPTKMPTLSNLPTELLIKIYESNVPGRGYCCGCSSPNCQVWVDCKSYFKSCAVSQKIFTAAQSAFWDRFIARSTICMSKSWFSPPPHGFVRHCGIELPSFLRHTRRIDIKIQHLASRWGQECMEVLSAGLENLPVSRASASS